MLRPILWLLLALAVLEGSRVPAATSGVVPTEAPGPAPGHGLASSAPAPGDSLGSSAPSGDSLGSWAPDPPRAGAVGGGIALVRHFGSDAWRLVTAPARLDRKGLVHAAGFLGAGAVLYAWDQEITDAFHRSRGVPVYDALITIGESIEDAGHMGRTNPYWVAGAALGTALRVEPLQRFTYEILESHLLSGGIRNASRLLIGRRRQHEGRGPRHFEWNGGTSFPSGHTSTAFELATMLAHRTRSAPLAAAWYGLAGTIALQRVDSYAHWPSDVLLSATQGVLVARFVIRRNAERRGRAAPAPLVGATPDGRGVMVTLRF